MWAYQSVLYQIYPLGFCGAPYENDGILEHRILKVKDWIPHIRRLGADAVYFSPVFASDTHGYNTRDYRTIDCRLGTNEDFKEICKSLHHAGIRIILDGVFHHAGRGFFAFRDVLKNKGASPYKDWFFLDFSKDNERQDGFSYECWEGHTGLVKLNLRNDSLVSYLLDSIAKWVAEFGIDGLRLDVAYGLDPDFLRRLRSFCDNLKPQFFLTGEVIHGDYNRFMNDSMLHSVTNYECYEDLHSGFNSMNLFTVNRTLLRQFGSDNWSMYKGSHLLSFVDNHDVSRIASKLTNPMHLVPVYGMLFAMPGIPCIYYGSEWGITGEKDALPHDLALRPAPDTPEWTALTDFISRLAAIKKSSDALNYGSFRSVLLTNQQCIFERKAKNDRLLIAINIAGEPFDAHFDAGSSLGEELITETAHNFKGGSILPPYSVSYWKMPN